MANLSPDERVIIAKHPFGNSLDQSRDSLRKAEQNYRPGPIPYNGTLTGQDQRRQETISNLLLALMGHKVAFNLRSKIENDKVATELSKLSDSFNAAVIITNITMRYHDLLSNKPLISTFGTLCSTSSPPSFEQPLLQAFLPPSMALLSRIPPPRSKVVNKPRNWWKEGSSKR